MPAERSEATPSSATLVTFGSFVASSGTLAGRATRTLLDRSFFGASPALAASGGLSSVAGAMNDGMTMGGAVFGRRAAGGGGGAATGGGGAATGVAGTYTTFCGSVAAAAGCGIGHRQASVSKNVATNPKIATG